MLGGAITLLLLGCAGGKDGGKDGDGDGDGGGDTTDINWTGACPAASGIGTATVWEYEYNEAYQDANDATGSYSVIVGDPGDNGEITLITAIETTSGNRSFESTSTSEYGCDDEGLWLLTTYYEYTVTVYEPYEGFEDYAFEAPILMMPQSVASGENWESVYKGTFETELGTRLAVNYSVTTEVTGTEDVTVPAGEYHAMVWTQTRSTGAESTVWVANGTGMVASEEADLVAFTP